MTSNSCRRAILPSDRRPGRILLYSLNYHPEPTGIGKYSGEMAQWLAKAGWDVRVVTAAPYYPDWKIAPGYDGGRYAREVHGGVTVFRAPIWVPRSPNGVRRLLHLASFALFSLPLLVQTLWWRPKVVWCVAPALAGAPAAAVFARLGGAKSWLHIQDFEVDAAFDLGMLRNQALRSLALKVESALLRSFDRVSSISERMVEKTIEKGVAPERTLLFQNWVDIDAIRPMPSNTRYRKELCIGDDAFVALYSGSMGAKQGLEILAEAARTLKDDPRIHFLFCGQGAGLAPLRAACEGLPRVHFLPLQPVENLSELLATASVHLLPQQRAAADLVLPSKLSGMLASGRPVIATAEPGTGLANWVEACGRVVPPGDGAALASALRELMEAPDAAAILGRNARARAEERLGCDAVLRRFSEAAQAL